METSSSSLNVETKTKLKLINELKTNKQTNKNHRVEIAYLKKKYFRIYVSLMLMWELVQPFNQRVVETHLKFSFYHFQTLYFTLKWLRDIVFPCFSLIVVKKAISFVLFCFFVVFVLLFLSCFTIHQRNFSHGHCKNRMFLGCLWSKTKFDIFSLFFLPF